MGYDLSMPGELVRYQQTGHFHFVTFSSFRRQPFLTTASSRDLFERSLETMRVRYDFVVVGYVLMPEHVHLLLSEPKKAILSNAAGPENIRCRAIEATSVLAGSVL